MTHTNQEGVVSVQEFARRAFNNLDEKIHGRAGANTTNLGEQDRAFLLAVDRGLVPYSEVGFQEFVNQKSMASSSRDPKFQGALDDAAASMSVTIPLPSQARVEAGVRKAPDRESVTSQIKQAITDAGDSGGGGEDTSLRDQFPVQIPEDEFPGGPDEGLPPTSPLPEPTDVSRKHPIVGPPQKEQEPGPGGTDNLGRGPGARPPKPQGGSSSTSSSSSAQESEDTDGASIGSLIADLLENIFALFRGGG